MKRQRLQMNRGEMLVKKSKPQKWIAILLFIFTSLINVCCTDPSQHVAQSPKGMVDYVPRCQTGFIFL